MKYLLFILAVMTILPMQAQEFNCYCPEAEPSPYYASPVQYQQPVQYQPEVEYVADPCNVVGTEMPRLIQPQVKPPTSVDVVLVASFSRLPILKKGYLVRYDAGKALYRVYVDFRRYSLVDAQSKAEGDGYCKYQYVTLPSRDVVGFYET